MLAKPGSKIVYKLSDDEGARAFARLLLSAARHPALPWTFALSDPATPWTIIAIERLEPLSAAMRSAWEGWVWKDYLRNWGAPISDPFSVGPLLSVMRQHLTGTNVGMDVLKPDNVMARPGHGQLVFSDPFF